VSGFVDIHAHLLPGIDDGPHDLDQALEMARAAVESGIATIVATPHLRSDFPDVHLEELGGRCEDLRGALAGAGISLEVVLGAEVSLTWAIEATDEELRLASYGQRGKDMLVETPWVHVAGVDRFLSVLRAKGYRVTLGHPERSHNFQGDLEPLRALVEQGVLLQINAESLLEPGGRRGPRHVARALLDDGLVHAIASDGHRANSWRPVTRLADAVTAAGELVGPERAHWLAGAAPGAIVAGAELPAPPPMEKAQKRRRLFGLRSR
jgi:protein-tyrosine phosphatase